MCNETIGMNDRLSVTLFGMILSFSVMDFLISINLATHRVVIKLAKVS